MKFNAKLVLLLSFTLSVGIIQSPQAIAVTQGEVCSTIGTLQKVGKVQFKCLGSEKIKFWIQVPVGTPSSNSVKSNLKQWNAFLKSISIEPYSNDAETQLSEDDIESLKNSRGVISEKIRLVEEIAANYKNTSIRLAASAKGYSDAEIEKKRINDLRFSEFQVAQNQTNALYSRYQSALSSSSARVACQVLKDFGFVGSCTGNAYQDALDTQTIRNYNALKSASDTAYQIYKSANADYLAARKLAPSALENSQLALDTSELYSARAAEWKTLDAQILVQSEYVTKWLADSLDGLSIYVEILERLPKTSNLLASLSSASKSNLTTRYQLAYLDIQFLKLAIKSYQSKLSASTEYIPIKVNLQEPQIWSPTRYYKSSNYSDIENTSGIDVAWNWSSNINCVTVSPCKRIFVVTSRDCNRGVVGLDFMTDAKISEARTSSKEYSFKAGEILLIEIETKYSATATSGYFRSFKCNP
jgi:hypothetical protein